MSTPSTFAGNLAFWGVLWGPVRNTHPLWQGKGAFMKLTRSTSVSGYKHCIYVILQCCNVEFGAGELTAM